MTLEIKEELENGVENTEQFLCYTTSGSRESWFDSVVCFLAVWMLLCVSISFYATYSLLCR